MLQRRLVPFYRHLRMPFALAACGDATHRPIREPRRRWCVPRSSRGQPPPSRSFTGIVAARVQSDLGFRVSGKVLERLVDAGQTVKRGQPLMRIDPTDLRLAMRAHRRSRRCRAGARAPDGGGRGAIPRPRRHRRGLGFGLRPESRLPPSAARAELNAAKAQADVARNETGYAVLVADADGVVVETLAEPGQVVGAGQIVVRVAHAGRREAVIELPETLRPAIGSTGRATLVSASGLTGPAKLRQLSDAANRQTRTFEARYVLEGRLADAPLGSTVTIQIPDGRPPCQAAAGTDRLDLRPGQGTGRVARRRRAAASHAGVPVQVAAPRTTTALASSASSSKAIASSRSARICCTKASRCEWPTKPPPL